MKKNSLEAHIADVRMRASGSDLTELFSAALEGMAELIKPGACNGEMNIEEKFECSAGDTTTLLINFLSEVLSLSHINRGIFCTVDFSELTETWLQATIRGKLVDGFDEDVKAVTHHEAKIEKKDDGNYESVVVFDI